MKPNIVITGIGAVTCVGLNAQDYWDALLKGVCGIRDLNRDPEEFPIQRAGAIVDFPAADFLPKRLVLDMDPFMQYAYISAEEALKQSGLPLEDADRIGIVMGSALSGIELAGSTQATFATQGKRAGPKFLPKVMGNMAAARLSIEHGIKGPSLTVSTACASGGDAVLLGSMLIEHGSADAVIVMAGESAICGSLVQSLAKTGALSKTGQSRPFDKKRDGFVAGEGGGAIILEREDHALARGAVILAQLMGCANNADAYNPVAPNPDGSGASKCIQLALEQAGLRPEDIDYINAHGTATQMGDIAESTAIHLVFGDHPVPVSSLKGSVGHLMGAGGVTELIACIKTVETGLIAPTIGCDEVDEACGLNVVAGAPLKADVRYAMSNALGFGGQNSSIIIGKYMR